MAITFGATDYFAFADTNTAVQSSTSNEGSEEYTALGATGNVVALTTGRTVTDYSTTYTFSADTGSLDISGVKPGTIVSGKVVTSVSVNYANDAYPTVTISGRSTDETSGVSTFTPSPTLAGTFGVSATPFGVTMDTGATAVSASYTISANIADVWNGDMSDELALDAYGGREEITVEAVGGGCTVDTGWTKIGSDISTSNTGYVTTTVTGVKYVVS